jgi:AraC family transcriptional regulator
MEPTILDSGQIILLGFSFFGDPFSLKGEWTEENEIGRLWQRFMAYMGKHRHRLQYLADETAGYEVHIEHEETALKGHYEVFVGMEVKKLVDVPVEMLVKILPPTTYAIFTLKGEQINTDWTRKIYEGWLPGSGYRAAYGYNFQFYDQRFKGLDNLAESELDVYVPIVTPS